MTKHILKSTVILFAIIFFFASCSKESKIRNKLSGTWKVTSATDSTINADLAAGFSFQYQFSDCKKKNEPCDGVFTLTYTFLGLPLSVSANYKWIVKEDVLTITLTDTTILKPASLHIDFTDKKKVTATDAGNSASIYQLDKL